MNTLDKINLSDVRFLLWLNGKSERKITALLARQISRCGDGYLYALLGVASFFWIEENGKAFFYCGLTAYLIELSLYFILKNTIRRPRPNGLIGLNALIHPSDTFSFPSGHTAGAFVFAILILNFFPTFGALALMGAVLIGLSRVVLGVHYPSDILAGAVLGSTCATLVLWLGHYL